MRNGYPAPPEPDLGHGLQGRVGEKVAEFGTHHGAVATGHPQDAGYMSANRSAQALQLTGRPYMSP